jgi:hypothetical protein
MTPNSPRWKSSCANAIGAQKTKNKAVNNALRM